VHLQPGSAQADGRLSVANLERGQDRKEHTVAWRVEHNPLERILELLVENGLGDLREPMTVLLNEAMKLERARHLGAGPW